MNNNQATINKMSEMRFHGMAQAFRTLHETGRNMELTTDEVITYLIDAAIGGECREVKGLELAKRFYLECVKPLIEERIPEIDRQYAAGLIGFGSDVLGNDDEWSKDHEWGPRLIIFLSKGIHDSPAKRPSPKGPNSRLATDVATD